MGRQRRNTLILALALLAVLGAVLLLQRLLQGDGVTAVVKVGSQVTHTLPLSRDQELWVGDEEIGRNLVRVKDGKVMVVEADCPDKVCVHTGAISQEGEVIACLPHGLIVYIPQKGA